MASNSKLIAFFLQLFLAYFVVQQASAYKTFSSIQRFKKITNDYRVSNHLQFHLNAEKESTSNSERTESNWKRSFAGAFVALAVSFGIFQDLAQPAAVFAADTVAVGKCLLQSCQKELAQCLLNPKCLANIVCLNTCNSDNVDKEAACQIRCGDLFENDVVGVFNSCAVSQKRCVPQKANEGQYPLPAPESLVTSFDTSIWNGRWYISAGLNKIFDTFDCQVHFFTSPQPGLFYAKLFWRITEPDGEFFTKNAVQRFKQDPQNPAHLINHDNEYLHYKDDWYVLDYDPSEFVLIYYRGSNDAWDGYGGAFLYTRSPTVKPELLPRLEKAFNKAKLPYKWSDFTLTDNSCKPQTESPTVLREKFARRLLITEEQQLQEQLTAVRNAAINTLVGEEKEAEKSIQYLEKELEAFQSELKKDAQLLEKKVERAIDNVL
jgi:violaxanthin de-epoxidase